MAYQPDSTSSTVNEYPKLLVSVLVALTACQTTSSTNDVPARISNPSAASRAALQNVVNDALRTEVLLADDALTQSSMLVIERKPPRTMQNLPATGRNMDPPIQFRLVTNGNDCILIDTRDGSRHPLENVSCVAE
jgi:hypothetical protein